MRGTSFDRILVAVSLLNPYTLLDFIVCIVNYQFFLDGTTVTHLSSSPEVYVFRS